jgi:ubiquinol-cytochrome c reductase cytochrome c subunit
MRNMTHLTTAFIFLAATAVTASAQSGGGVRGKEAYAKFGCYQCHGYVGQGALAYGPPLAPRPMPSDAFKDYVRAPRNVMPPYSRNILPDDVLSDIYTYVASIKAPPPVAEIKLLNLGKASPTVDIASTKGSALYMQSCAGCHGAPGAGSATAPILPGKYRGKNARDVADIIKSPPAKMPKLFPDTLKEDDVAALSAYIVRQ